MHAGKTLSAIGKFKRKLSKNMNGFDKRRTHPALRAHLLCNCFAVQASFAISSTVASRQPDSAFSSINCSGCRHRSRGSHRSGPCCQSTRHAFSAPDNRGPIRNGYGRRLTASGRFALTLLSRLSVFLVCKNCIGCR